MPFNSIGNDSALKLISVHSPIGGYEQPNDEAIVVGIVQLTVQIQIPIFPYAAP